MKRWSEADNRRLRQMYARQSWEQMSKALGRTVSAVKGQGQKLGLSRGRKRFGKTPQSMLDDCETLIRESNYPVRRCAALSGAARSAADKIAKKYRKSLANGRWIDLQTGQVRPQVCDTQCAIEATGLSQKTILRRRQAGLISTKRSVSNPQMPVFTPFDIRRLKQIGRLKAPGRRVLSEDEVREIRRLGDKGQSVRKIAERYPQVSQKQIRRIRNRTQWKDLK